MCRRQQSDEQQELCFSQTKRTTSTCLFICFASLFQPLYEIQNGKKNGITTFD